MQKVILFYFLFINLLSFVIYTFDKFKSTKGYSRISELELHTFSLMGGFLGATLSMVLFRHKVKKETFLVKHIFILLAWIIGILYYFIKVDTLNFVSL